MGLTYFHRQAIKMIMVILVIILACRFTNDYAMAVIAVVGAGLALMNERGKALVIYLIFPFIGIFNPILLPHSPLYSMFARLGTMGMTFALLISAVVSKGREQVPLGGLYGFMVVAAISSMQGWFPMISYLKLLNFAVFISGIYMGTRNLHHRPDDIVLLRATFMALACIMILGSLATLPFPAVAYLTSMKYYIREGGVEYANALYASGELSRLSLFAGITNHSQFVAPMLVCSNAWVLCDMLLVERKISKLHVVLLAVAPLLIYMSRSRVGFFGYVGSIGVIYFIALRRGAVPARVLGMLRSGMVLMGVLIVVVAMVAEVRHQALTRWLRKTEEVELDTRSLGEAVTASRQGGVELCLSEFRRSPLLGSGFQVVEGHRQAYEAGHITLFSAPIEKGILPLMVLGETGILGATMFGVFLFIFITGCLHRKYYATLSLLFCLLFTNMGEATFFAPSGGGGVLWMLTAVGGFLIDMTCVVERRRGSVQQLFIMPELTQKQVNHG